MDLAEQDANLTLRALHRIKKYAPWLTTYVVYDQPIVVNLAPYDWSLPEQRSMGLSRVVLGHGLDSTEALHSALEFLLPQIGFMSGFRFLVMKIQMVNDPAGHGVIMKLGWSAV